MVKRKKKTTKELLVFRKLKEERRGWIDIANNKRA
jgi:hypothetical protein